MKKYKVTLLILIIGISGFIVYNNYFKPWKDAEKYIGKYMEEQGVSKDEISSITKQKSKKASYNGILYKVFYEDDPGYEYQYFYSNNYHALYVDKVLLQIYDVEDNSRLLKSNEELKGVKYLPIYLKDDLNK